MAVRNASLVLLCVGALPACGIDFVAVERAPPTFVTVTTEHRDGLFASVQVESFHVLRIPVVIVSGDTVEAEVLGGGRTRHTTNLSPDSLDPFIHLRIEPGEGALDVRLPVLLRTGSAHRGSDGQLVLPVELPETERAVEGMDWLIRFVSADGRSTLQVLGSGALPEPLSFPMALIPAATVHVQVNAIVRPEPTSSWADVIVLGSVVFPIPDP